MSIQKKRLLCVEDHLDMQELLRLVFRDYEYVSAYTKQDCFQCLGNSQFDIIVIDYYLPDGTGDDLCRAIRASDSRTPILFITGSDDISDHESQCVGGHGIIKKNRPDFISALRDRVAGLI